MKKIVLLRHGESVFNKENRFTGWTDVDLSEKGLGEAKEAGWLTVNDWSMFEQNVSILDTPYISSDEVMALRKKVIGEFYFNARKIFKTLAKVRSFGDIIMLLSLLKR